MKHTKLMFAAMLIVLPCLASAQLGSNTTIKARIPFEFVAGNKLVPAGDCAVQRGTTDGMTLMIRNVRANVALLSSADRTEAKEIAGSYALVFHREGDQYFLRGIKLEGSRVSYRLPESKAEAELRARNIPATEEIVLASLQ
jgi:hypothetical protein